MIGKIWCVLHPRKPVILRAPSRGICPTEITQSAQTPVSANRFVPISEQIKIFEAVCRKSWHQTGVFLSNLQLYVGNLQGLRTEVLTILTSNRGVFVKLAAVCWQPTGLKDGSLDNLDIKQGCFCQTCSCVFVRTEVLTSNREVSVKLAAVCWQPTGHKDGSFDIKQGWFCQTCSCMLATYRAQGRKSWQSWHQTGRCLPNLQLCVRKDGSLDIKQGGFCQTCSCMLATYRA